MGKKKKTLLLQPIRGKFVQSNINGKIVRIWLVDPDTNQQGTEIPYTDAISVLALPHPVVCMAQIKDKSGKYCNLLDDDDKLAIEEKKDEYLYGESTRGFDSTEFASGSSDSADLRKLVETQAELIKSQSKQLDAMQSKFEEIQKSMEKLSKKAKEEKKERKAKDAE